MNNCFLSVVTVIEDLVELQNTVGLLTNLSTTLPDSFADYEIILVNNSGRRDFEKELAPLPSFFKQNIFMINLSSSVVRNHAIVAGLDRANGDYTVIFESKLWDKSFLINDLYNESVKGVDMVYLRAKQRKPDFRYGLFYKLFYWILKNYSDLKVDDKAHDTRIISRRALNSLLRLRENLQYMKAIYSMVGYGTKAIEVDIPLENDKTGFTDKFRTSLIAITSFTTFLRSLLLWIFLVSIVFMILVIFNAVKVRFTNYDLLGTYHETLPGWTFLVVLTSIFFAITCLILYIMSIYLSNIYQEIKHRPMYIIESIKRFS